MVQRMIENPYPYAKTGYDIYASGKAKYWQSDKMKLNR